jgi:hypothetical protein
MPKLSKFNHLSPCERRLLIKATCLLAAIRIGLWLIPFQAQRSLLARLGSRHPGNGSSSSALVEKIVWAVETAAPHIPGVTCLTLALAAKLMLLWAGCPSLLHIGVAKDDKGRLQAHAWLNCQGKRVIGGLDTGSYRFLSAL